MFRIFLTNTIECSLNFDAIKLHEAFYKIKELGKSGGVLKCELSTDVRSAISTTTLY